MRILVVEDHASLARSIANGLREEGFAVDLTADGDEAMQWSKLNPYDCVVLDVMLPGKDGWTVLQHIRRQGSNVPVLMLTARDAVDDRVKGLNLGADDYLVKPFAWEEMLARVRALVRRGHDKKTPTIQVGDLEIDTASKSVKRSGRPIALSGREYALLEYLAHREGRVVSRGEIWDHIYDQADETTSNVVDVYIGYLRNKIDRDFPTKLIHTRRGLGYILSAQS
ncbi:MAG TPA: response regulator transcription factor [Tepidisphaeraceae bacterium]|jgi:DNA-binding response OmpR family regulator|nr:response regulator transcription factor [Tepidisphaeraceae bacterium]